MGNLREKVIKGLEHCMGDHTCEECPYENGCANEMMGDALELLKAQEPRVLALAELRKMPTGALLWNEWEPVANSPVYPVEFEKVCFHTFPDGVTQEIIEFINGMDYADIYGKRFRFWTAKPTDEQRKAVKWE